MSERGKSNFESFLRQISPDVFVNFHTQGKAMSEKGKSNFESFLRHTSPNVSVNTQSRRSSSSSRAKAEEVRKPYVGLRDIWSAYEDWSTYALGVPLTVRNTLSNVTVTQYYVPTLSAIQIFTKQPFVDGSSSRSFGTDSHLYVEFNETASFDDRAPLTQKVDELAKQHHGLNSLTSSDLSQFSWFSVAWSPLYQIPEMETVKALSVSFLTYHSLTPLFPETFPLDTTVGLPAFGVVTSKLSGKVWTMPGTSDEQKINMHEEYAASWLGKLMFKHSDFELFMAEKSSDLPLPNGW